MPAAPSFQVSAGDELALDEARRIALRAQGFGDGTRRAGTAAPRAREPTAADVRKLVERLGAVQIDAVNVLVRAHYLPAFSRLGPYERSLIDRVAYEKGHAFEYLGHALSFVPTALHPAFRWRMEEAAKAAYWTAGKAAIDGRNPGYVDRVLAEVTARGPLSFKELADPARRDRPVTKYSESSLLWWSKRPSDGKHVLEGLWREGRLAVAARRAGFERAFDLAERVLPAATLAMPAPSVDDAQRTLVRHAVIALGVGWVRDVADVFRLPLTVTKARLRELVDEGAVTTTRVEGVSDVAFLDPSATRTRGNRTATGRSRALLSPFDSLLWDRERNVRLFGFRHSFEIYVPEPKRRYGYYVLPFLLDGAIVARADLKADRSRQTLVVQAAYIEPGAAAAAVARALGDELETMARWLELDAVEVVPRGDLAGRLSRRFRRVA